jgi:hypothetical protein
MTTGNWVREKARLLVPSGFRGGDCVSGSRHSESDDVAGECQRLIYEWSAALRPSVTRDNVLNAMPPKDSGYAGTDSVPYNPCNYNVYGRSYQRQVTH